MQKTSELTVVKFLAILIGAIFGAMIFLLILFGLAGFFINRLLY